jgi:2-polyprenyl-3-methyl-5-hydroxy-6-metoxy-1,4-benzoquinol methylase
MEHVTCGLCGSAESILFMTRVDRFSGESFNLVHCEKCGLIYLDPRPTQSEIEAYYTDDYECFTSQNSALSSSQIRPVQRAMSLKVDFVEKHTLRCGKMLDLGCATGDFLNAARGRGWEVKGIELVDRAAHFAQEQYHLDVSLGSLESVQLPESYYDVVTLWDVLEHLPSPKHTLGHIWRILKPGGWLVFSVPNLKAFDRYLFGASWIGWDVPRHFYLFSENHLIQLLDLNSFKFIEKKCFIGGKGTFWLSLINRFEALGTTSQGIEPVISAALWPYRQFAYLFDRGPIITYIGRKNLRS